MNLSRLFTAKRLACLAATWLLLAPVTGLETANSATVDPAPRALTNYAWECWGPGNYDPCLHEWSAVAAVAPDDVWASSIDGALMHWDGTVWHKVVSPAARGISDIRMLSATDGWAINGSTVLRWDGLSWTAGAQPTGIWMYDIDMLSDTDGWVVGGSGRIQHWNGTSWNAVTSPTTYTLRAVDMVSATDGWAVGGNGSTLNMMLHWDGHSWSIASRPTSGWLEDIEMVSATDGWAVGIAGALLRWNGSSWAKWTSPVNWLWAVDMVSATDGWAVGFDGAILHWNGASWTSVPDPSLRALEAVSMISSSNGWIVGSNGAVLRWNGSTWVSPGDYTNSWLPSIDMVSPDEGWAAGSGGVIRHWKDGIWTPDASPTNRTLNAVDMVTVTDGWVVGDRIALHWNGSAWINLGYTIPGQLMDVDMVTAADGWTVGYMTETAYFQHWNGSDWVLYASPISTPLSALSMVSATDGWAVGAEGAFVRWNGQAWLSAESPTTKYVVDVSMLSATDGWAVAYGTDGENCAFPEFFHWNGAAWESVQAPGEGCFNRLAMVSPMDGWAVGDSGSMAHWNGTTWTLVESITPQTLMAVDVIRNGDRMEGFAVGSNGVVLRFQPLQDLDGDALPDAWEINGYDANHDGKVDVDLPAMGASPTHKDVFVEVDYMIDRICVWGGCLVQHSHKPNPDAIALVVEAFKDAPVSNPDGVHGITLHVDAGRDSVMAPGRTWGALSRANVIAHRSELTWADFDATKNASFEMARRPIFHYAIFAHFLSGADKCTSGQTRHSPDVDLIIALGGWGGDPKYDESCDPAIPAMNTVGTSIQQAGTLMHELGHDLGLLHGGSDDVAGKPNYLSVMNYFFQMRGVPFDHARRFDYSGTSLTPPLVETSLLEGVGLNGGSATALYGTRWTCPSGALRATWAANDPIDWNCNDTIDSSSVAVNVNRAYNQNSPADETLGTYNDWAGLSFGGGGILGSASVAGSPLPASVGSTVYQNELTLDMDRMIEDEYAVGLYGPGGYIGLPGAATSYTITVANRGSLSDTYALALTSSLNWLNGSGLPATVSLAPGETREVTLAVTIPLSAPRDAVDVGRILVTSQAQPWVWSSHFIETTTLPRLYLPLVRK